MLRPCFSASCILPTFARAILTVSRRNRTFLHCFYCRVGSPGREWPAADAAAIPAAAQPCAVLKLQVLPSLLGPPLFQTELTFLRSCDWRGSIAWNAGLLGPTQNFQACILGPIFAGWRWCLWDREHWDWLDDRGAGWSCFFLRWEGDRWVFAAPSSCCWRCLASIDIAHFCCAAALACGLHWHFWEVQRGYWIRCSLCSSLMGKEWEFGCSCCGRFRPWRCIWVSSSAEKEVDFWRLEKDYCFSISAARCCLPHRWSWLSPFWPCRFEAASTPWPASPPSTPPPRLPSSTTSPDLHIGECWGCFRSCQTLGRCCRSSASCRTQWRSPWAP